MPDVLTTLFAEEAPFWGATRNVAEQRITIRKLMKRWDIGDFAFDTDEGGTAILEFDIDGTPYRLKRELLPLQGAATDQKLQQARRQAWSALHWHVKTLIEMAAWEDRPEIAVASYMVGPDGSTLGERSPEQLRKLLLLTDKELGPQ
jgi:hypothetical protein